MRFRSYGESGSPPPPLPPYGNFVYRDHLTSLLRWVWHTHMLAPSAYWSDLEASVLRRVIAHDIEGWRSDQSVESWMRSDQGLESWMEGEDRSKELWRSFTDEAWELDLDINHAVDEMKFSCGFSYDLYAACKRQAAFYYQVSLPHFREAAFLQKCIRQGCIKFCAPLLCGG